MIKKTFTLTKRGDGVWVGSTPGVDRDEDIVLSQGLDLSAWQAAGAPVLFGHDYASYWSTIGHSKRHWTDSTGFYFEPVWRKPATESDPMTVIQAMLNSDPPLLRSASIGFRPLQWEERTDGNGRKTSGRIFHSAELLEVSVVNIGANADAGLARSLATVAKSLGTKGYSPVMAELSQRLDEERMLRKLEALIGDLAHLHGVELHNV